MVLTLIPCSDHYFESNSLDKQEQHSHNSENHDCGQDACTPFCTCTCCGIALNAADFHLFKLDKPFEAYLGNELILKNYPLVSIFQENIWQPPQV